MTEISQAAIDLIVDAEVSDRATYERLYRRSTWPGGRSGVTIGIGYDVGYVTHQELRDDWQDHLSVAVILMLQDAIGVHGTAAKDLCASLRRRSPAVIVSWDAAMAVFLHRDVPKWTGRVEAALPNTDRLPADCLGALVSLAYNRGADFSSAGDRRIEMRAIRTCMQDADFAGIPAQLRAMKRLWPDMKGLRDRREAEAKLFEAGLKGILT